MQCSCSSPGQWYLNNCLSFPKVAESLSKTLLTLMGAETSVEVIVHINAGIIKCSGRQRQT